MSDLSALLAAVPASMSAINPFGDTARAVGGIMACRVEIKRLRNEAEKLERSFQAERNPIDAALKFALRVLEDRRSAMERFVTMQR